MRRRPPLDRDFLLALRVLAKSDLSPADACRALAPTAARIGKPRPCYGTVRRVLNEERRRYRARKSRRDQIIAELLAGLVMKPMWRVTQGSGVR
jgi:hypothetical protein